MFDKICGKTISVNSLHIDVTNIVTVKMTYTADGSEPFVAEFRNVSSLNLRETSFPFEFSGLEIIDNSQRGWERDKRYFVNDYEDGRLSFYCEKITM